MARTFNQGVLIGAQDPPVDFEQWLRSEIEYAKTLVGQTGRPPVNPVGSLSHASALARLGTLQEVDHIFKDSKR